MGYRTMKGFEVNVIYQSYTPKVDGSMKLAFVTAKELTYEDSEPLFDLRGMEGKLMFSLTDAQPVDILKIKGEYEGKTPSERLRSRIFVRYAQLGKKGDFEVYYRKYIEKFIQEVQQNIDATNDTADCPE